MKSVTQGRKGAKGPQRPREEHLYSAVGMRTAHISVLGFGAEGVVMLCGLVLGQWRGSDGKRVCKHCLKEWRLVPMGGAR